jgi:hypothetical protein
MKAELLKAPASEKPASESSGDDFGTISEANLPKLGGYWEVKK